MSRKKIARILLVLAVVASLTLAELTPLSLVQDASAVTQADIDKLKDELSGMNSEKSQLEKELKSIQNDKSAALAQKENIDKQINLLQSEIKGVESLISEYETLITQTEQEIRENEEEEARQYEKFCERVRSMEERGTVSYWSVLFDSASFSDLLSAMDFISEAEIRQALKKEAALVEQRLSKGGALIAMCIEGQEMSSVALSQKMQQLAARGASQLTFLIGSSFGLDEDLKKKADLRLSMSPMTFPHHLARVMLLEQIYRAYQIEAGTKYHK